MHHIQKHILSVLTKHETVRFARLRPPRTDSNLFSYHLKSLLKEKLVDKTSAGYTLSSKGLALVDRLSMSNLEPRLQPKIITMAVIFNSRGDVLAQKRKKQPFIDTITLPSGKLHMEDESILAAACREVKEKTGLKICDLKHVGDFYIKVKRDTELVSSVLAHIFLSKLSSSPNLPAGTEWLSLSELKARPLAPAIEKIIESVASNATGIFQEININYDV